MYSQNKEVTVKCSPTMVFVDLEKISEFQRPFFCLTSAGPEGLVTELYLKVQVYKKRERKASYSFLNGKQKGGHMVKNSNSRYLSPSL